MMLNISHIQRFSLGDGPGIRTTVFFKGCNLCCPWCHNPETQSSAPETLIYAQAGKTTLCGRQMTAQDICAIVLRDADFYAESGGGVTLSGGEALLQPEGTAELAALLKLQGLHVLLDTAGDAPWSAFEALAPYIDQYYYDWKAPSPEAYRAIGGDHDRILSNLRRLLAEGRDLRVRVPLIEGFNTGPVQIEAICATLQQAGARSVDLLPFHRLGSGKYAALSRPYAYASCPTMPLSRAEELASHFEPFFEVNIER